jgi:hypothetical protein
MTERYPGQRAYRLVTGRLALLYGGATLVLTPLCLTPLAPVAVPYALSGAVMTGLFAYAWGRQG